MLYYLVPEFADQLCVCAADSKSTTAGQLGRSLTRRELPRTINGTLLMLMFLFLFELEVGMLYFIIPKLAGYLCALLTAKLTADGSARRRPFNLLIRK